MMPAATLDAIATTRAHTWTAALLQHRFAAIGDRIRSPGTLDEFYTHAGAAYRRRRPGQGAQPGTDG